MGSRDQLEAVRRVQEQGSKSLSAALGVHSDAKPHELRKAYRRLALLLHPDKNKAPGAGEAFKTVTNAFEALTVKDKREGGLKEEVSVSSFKKFFNGHTKSGGAVVEAESDEEVNLPEQMFVSPPASQPSPPKTNNSSIYYGPPPPM